MKNCFLSFLVLRLFLPNSSFAQAYIYHPFPYTNAIWNTAYIDIQGCNANPCSYVYDELGIDTNINNIEYVKILEGSFGNSNDEYFPPVFQGLLIRNDTLNKEVKILKIAGNLIDSEQLLYDFNLNVGDTLPNSFIGSKSQGIVVLKIDSILLQDGTYRKRFKLNVASSGTYPDSLCLIEGIGYTGGLFVDITNTDFEGGAHLACNSYQGTTLYNFAPFQLTSCDVPSGVNQVKKPVIQIQPNPVVSGGNITIKGISENYSVTISNVLGQTVLSVPMSNSQSIILPDSIKSGVYICRIITQDNLLLIKKIVVI